MPLQGYSVGRDVTLTVVTSAGVLPILAISGFTSKPEIIEERFKLLDGRTRRLRYPDAWTGSFTLERTSSVIDDYFADFEANYYAGLSEIPSSITQSITESSGAISQYRYTGVLLTLDDAGDWAGDKRVTQRLRFTSERRLKIA